MACGSRRSARQTVCHHVLPPRSRFADALPALSVEAQETSARSCAVTVVRLQRASLRAAVGFNIGPHLQAADPGRRACHTAMPRNTSCRAWYVGNYSNQRG